MSTISQVSSYARYLSQSRTLNTVQSNVDQLTKQLTTGKKSTDLAFYGAETQKLLDLRSELVSRDNYIQSINTALPRVEASDKVLDALEKLATDWQSSNLMPFEPGPPTISSASNANPEAMAIKINSESSDIRMGGRYTVTAEPAGSPAVNGTYNVTITDGLGGRTTRAINLNTVPPDDGKGYNFTMNGGPGDGAVLNLSFDSLQAASSSTFNVTFKQADDLLARVEDSMRDVRQYLNERFGDRYLFSGARYDTEPVTDLLAGRQTSRVTFNGTTVEDQDYFELSIDNNLFSIQVDGTKLQFTSNDGKTTSVDLESEANLTTTNVAKYFAQFINQNASPALSTTLQARDGVMTVTSPDTATKFDIAARVVNRASVDNAVTPITTTQAATTALPQIDSFRLQGEGVDIGDTFEYEIAVGDANDPYNLKYYELHPSEPRDLPPYQTYSVSYTVTAEDMASGAVRSVTDVATKLVSRLGSLNPAPPVTASVNADDPTRIDITTNATLSASHPGQTHLITTTAGVTNGSIQNSVSVATLPPESYALSDVPYVGNPTLPYYDAGIAGARSDASAWDKAKVTADSGLTLEYGVVSVDPAFQTLIEGLRMARVAASNPGKFDEYVSTSRELLAKAQEEMRSLHAKVASDSASLKKQLDLHKAANTSVTNQIANIEGINETEVAARLKTAMTAQEAAYTIIGQSQKMSLINYMA